MSFFVYVAMVTMWAIVGFIIGYHCGYWNAEDKAGRASAPMPEKGAGK